jgi:hypothetical protein
LVGGVDITIQHAEPHWSGEVAGNARKSLIYVDSQRVEKRTPIQKLEPETKKYL